MSERYEEDRQDAIDCLRDAKRNVIGDMNFTAKMALGRAAVNALLAIGEAIKDLKQ